MTTSASSLVELLPAAPAALTRPLALVDGRAYAAAWPHFRLAPPPSESPARPASPAVIRQDLLILRDDGLAFGVGGDQPLAGLPLQPRLPITPPSDRLWSPAALQAYRLGQRPDPVRVFTRLADTFDAFMDFKHSLGPQRHMAEFLAAYTLTTWLSDAFSVLGVLWLTSHHPAGPTRLLHLLARLCHLGHIAPAGSLTATLRGFAAYGAAIAFDDLDSHASRRAGDSAWNDWLLAGSRRGAPVLTRQYDYASQRTIAYALSTFCPRLFASTSLPDARLAPDCLIVPLVPPGDARRAAMFPQDPAAWPHHPVALYDDLWAIGLAHLSALPAYDTQVAAAIAAGDGALAGLPPAALFPWRATLAVALWLSAAGLPGLYDRMLSLAVAHHEDRADSYPLDFNAFIVRAIMERVSAYSGYSTSERGGVPTWRFSTRDIISTAQLLHEPETDFPRDYLSEQRVGRLLKRMCPVRPPRTGRPTQTRLWQFTLRDLEHWSFAYGLPLPDNLAALLKPAAEGPAHPA